MRIDASPPAPLFTCREEADAFASSLGTRLIGTRLVHCESTGSTNDALRRLADAGEPEGLVFSTEHQTSGRGREGRTWHSPPGSGLLFSYLVRPGLPSNSAAWLTAAAALGVASAVREHCGVQASIDWPNDVVAAHGKLGGVLAEAAIRSGRIELAVVGVGLNVNLDVSALPTALARTASSLSHETGRSTDRQELFRRVLLSIDERWAAVLGGRTAELARELESLSANMGRPFERAGFEPGTVEGIDDLGRLVLRTTGGRTVSVGL
jgi:BirA family biotin operon repressor/biotin-[acetyl-CoA-carboxylase] ligase